MKRKWISIIIGMIWMGIISLFLFSFPKKEEFKINRLDVNSEQVQNLYQSVVPNHDAYILSQLYDKMELTNEYKLNIGIMDLTNKTEQKESNLEASQVEKSINQILGNDTTVSHQSVTFMINGHCGYHYNEMEKRYEPVDGCENIPNEYFNQKLKYAFEKEDKIILIEQSIYTFIRRVGNANNVFVYNNYQQDKMLDYIENDDGIFYKIKEEKYINKGSFYKYIFKKEQGDYVLERFQKCDDSFSNKETL